MSGSLSASIYNQANKPAVALQTPVESLTQAGQAAALVNQAQTYRANRLIGQAFQQSIDPATGQTMQNALGVNLRNLGPDAAVAVPAALSTGQALAGQQQQVAQQRNQAILSAVGSVLNAPDDQLHDAATSALQRLVATNVLPQDDAVRIALQLPNDKVALRSTLDQMQKQLLSPGDQRAQTYGTPFSYDNGQSLNAGVQAPAALGGGLQTNTSVPTGFPTRSNLSELVPTVGADGVTRMVPRGSLVNQAGGASLTGQAGAGLGGAPPNPGGGRYVPTLTPGVPPSAPAPVPNAAAPAPTASNGVAVSPGSNVLDANKADFEAFNTARGQVAAHEQNVQTLQLAKQNLAGATTGKGSGPLQGVLSVLNTFAPEAAKRIGSAVGTDAEKYDEANKLLTDYARQSGAATHSDAQLNAAQTSNPSVHIAQQAAQDIASLQIGRERQAIAFTKLAPDQQTGLGYQQHASAFASKTDPRGFAWDTYSPEQQQNLLKSVSGNAVAKQRLLRSIGMAASQGWVQPPSAAAPAATAKPTPPPAPPPPPDVPTGY